MRILVTGSNGFVGNALCAVLDQTEHQVIRAVRKSTKPWEKSVGDLNESTQWADILSSRIDVVVHLAGRTALTNSVNGLKDDLYRVNTLGTANLARQCSQRGVKRFLFVSTAKVMGEGKENPYHESDPETPDDAYAISKWEAEQKLWQIAAETDMEVVVLRPPLVYGPRVAGNFLRLLQAIDKRRLLPLGAVNNRRSLIYLGNLVAAIQLCLTHPEAVGKSFMVSDGDDVSTPELIRRVAAAIGRKPFLLPVYVSWIRYVGTLLGKQAAVKRLLGSMAVDISPIQEYLGWTPPYTMEDGLKITAKWYHTAHAIH